PAVVEGVHGEGKYMLAAFDAGIDGSDLAVSSMFLPLLHRAVVYLAGETGQQRQSYTVGERIEVQVPLAPAERRADAGARGDRQADAGGWDDRGAGVLDERRAQAGVPDATAPKGNAAGAAASEASRTFTVTTPSGQKDAAVARFVGKMAIVSYDNTREP